jgi:hypothetical protein
MEPEGRIYPSNYCKYILGTLSQNRYGLFCAGAGGASKGGREIRAKTGCGANAYGTPCYELNGTKNILLHMNIAAVFSQYGMGVVGCSRRCPQP